MKYTRCIHLILCLITTAVSAQPYTLKRLGVENGLSNNYVVDLTQDRKGCLWIATESGLNRFDGRQFTTYTKSNSGLSANELNAVLADPIEDKVWIGTQRNGLCCFDYHSESITRLSIEKNGLLTNDVTHLAVAADSGIWVVHYHLGIDYYDRKNKKFISYSSQNIKGLIGNHWTASDDGKGNLYVGHVVDGMSIISLKDRTAKNYVSNPNDPYSIPGNEVRSICIDKNQNVWVGTNRGLALFNPLTEKFTTFRHVKGNPQSILSDKVFEIKQMKDGTLWIGTYMGGISILDLHENAFIAPENTNFHNITVTNNDYSLSGPNVRSIIQDSFGNIWIGNYRGGVDFISYAQPTFNTIAYTVEKQGGSINNKQVWGLWADNDQQIWIGGEGELGIYERGEKTKTFSLPQYQLHHQTHIHVIYEDSQKRLWLGSYQNGILLYTPRDKSITRIGDTQSENLDIRCFYEDPNGKMWIGTEGGIYSYSNQQLSFETEINQLLPDKMIHGILRDKKGNMWIGTFGKGVSILDAKNKLAWNFVIDNGFPSNAVNHMITDSKNRVWIATREGMVVFPDIEHPERQTIYGAKEGLENLQVRAIQEDLKGNIWISTNGGI